MGFAWRSSALGDRRDRAGPEIVTAPDQLTDLVDDRLRGRDLVVAAVERQHVAAQEDLAVELGLERPQDRVLCARQLFGDLVGQLQLGSHERRSLTAR